MKSYVLCFIVVFSYLGSGCNKINTKDEKIAKVYGKTLHNSEIDYKTLGAIDSVDSTTLKNLFIEHWIRNQLLLHEAKLNSEDLKAIDKLTEKYKNSLIVNYYKDYIIDQHLDTSISGQELKAYFDQLKSKFKLKDEVVNVKFIKLIADKQTIKKIKQLWDSGNYKGITDYISLNSEESALNNDYWLTKTELAKKLPKSLLQDKTKYETQKNINGTEFFLKVTDTRHKNEIIPLPLVRDDIKDLIIKKRKTDLIDNFITDLYLKETKNNNVIIYD